ncbi:MAG: hypothetical protein Q9187_003244 [Circinaria calcarea]
MPLSFLSLPPEIRNKVYHLLFDWEDGEVINGHIPHQKNAQGSSTAVWAGLPLLTTCKVVNIEASTMMYGSCTFTFNDTPDSNKTKGTEGSSFGIAGMYTFLRLIGLENRMRIRQIALQISNKRTCCYLEEIKIPSKEKLAFNGKPLGDALNLLAAGHGLQYIFVGFTDGMKGPHQPSSIANSFFRPIKESKLLQELSRIKGLTDFVCEAVLDEKCRASYRQLRKLMTQPKRSAVQKTKEEVKAMDIGARLVNMAKRRVELGKQIEAGNAQIEEWTKLHDRIAGLKAETTGWQQEIDNIDRTLGSIGALSSTMDD